MIIEKKIDWMAKRISIEVIYPFTEDYTAKVRELEGVVKDMFGQVIGSELWEHIKKYDAPTKEELKEKKLYLGITNNETRLIRGVLSVPIDKCWFGKNIVCELGVSSIWGEDLKFLTEFCKKNNYFLEIIPTCETYTIKIVKKYEKCSCNEDD